MTWVQNEREFWLNRDFQRAFNGFYRIRRNAGKWQPAYYGIMGQVTQGGFSFEKILNEVYQQTNFVEASYSSKLYATIYPDEPVIDRFVLENMGLKLNNNGENGVRLKRIVELYNNVKKNIQDILESDMGKYAVGRFREEYPNHKITDTKVIDLVLWRIRK
jgi:hypothetical protein